ncbi:MAG: ATP-binding protein [Candidatus Micrarchaeia archaeon]
MKIAVSGGKGGTGKTFVATGLAIADATQRKTLLVDADVECPNSHVLLGAKMKKAETIWGMVPKIDEEKCKRCGACARVCIKKAISAPEGFPPVIMPELCVGCGACVLACPTHALTASRKKIGRISTGKAHGLLLATGELEIGEPSSGEAVSAVMEFARKKAEADRAEDIVVDCAAGIGCPVIASISTADYLVAVTEPSPAALHDLERIWRLGRHFGMPCGIVLNKSTLSQKMAGKIRAFARKRGIPMIGCLPFSRKIIKATVDCRPIALQSRAYFSKFMAILSMIRAKRP